MVYKRIEQFELEFDHYKKILKRKGPYPTPVLSYKTSKDAWIRVDAISRKKWLVSVSINQKGVERNNFENFDTAYEYVVHTIMSNRIRMMLSS